MSDITASKIQAYAHSALANTGAWVRQFGGRLAGSAANRQTAEALCAALNECGAAAAVEPFSAHPDTFNQFYRIHAVLYLMAVAFLWFGYPLVSALIFTLIIAALYLQFGRYVELYDRFYSVKTGYNVTAVLEPRGEPRRQLIFSGHHDSAQELRFLRKWQKWYGLRIIVPELFHLLGALTAWAWVIWTAVFASSPPFGQVGLGLLTAGTVFVISKVFMFTREVSPGAGDNLIASAIVVELARIFAAPDGREQSSLAHTRLIFASFDAEEAGLRGSRAWVKANRKQLQGLPTWALNMDSIYCEADLQCLTSDLNHHIALDADLADRCVRIAGACGSPMRLARMKFGGGATDAAELVRAGVKATTLLAMSTDVVRDGLVYHTTRDTVEAIDPAAVEACLKIAVNLAYELDREA